MKKILVITTGGTIAMKKDRETRRTDAGCFRKRPGRRCAGTGALC